MAFMPTHLVLGGRVRLGHGLLVRIFERGLERIVGLDAVVRDTLPLAVEIHSPFSGMFHSQFAAVATTETRITVLQAIVVIAKGRDDRARRPAVRSPHPQKPQCQKAEPAVAPTNALREVVLPSPS